MEAKFADGHAIPFKITAAASLGRGATADVHFVIVGDKRYAAKIYRSGTEFSAEKIASMWMMRDPSVQQSVTFAWPKALVYESGSIIGYLMSVFEKADHHPLNYYFDSTLISRLNDKSITSLSNRVEIARSLCSAIDAIHARSTFFIDLKPQNVLVNSRTNAVVILDCDGFSIRTDSGRIFPAGHVSTDYIAPEVTRERLPPSALAAPQDNYALAVILFQMFNYSQHPFQGTPVSETSRPFTNDELAAEGLYPYSLTPNLRIKPRLGSTHVYLPADMRLLFDRSFIGLKDSRVTPHEWCLYFSSIITEKRLQRCNRFPNIIEHIHFKDCGCPECARERQKVLLSPVQPLPPNPAILTPTPPIRPVAPRKTSSTWQWLMVACIAALIFFIFTIARNDSAVRKNEVVSTVNDPIVSNNDVVTTKSALARRKENEALIEKKLLEKTSDADNEPKNPTDLGEVSTETIINADIQGNFSSDNVGGASTFTVVLPQTIPVRTLENPGLFIANNDCLPSNDEIAKAQAALRLQGFKVGKVDGIMGPATISALKQFQKDKGLPLTGSLTKETAKKLGALGIYVAGYDYNNFKFHSRGKVFPHASGTIVQFFNVKRGFLCFAVTKK